MLTQSLQCPECGSTEVWKAGLRYTSYGEIQRYVCRDCGYRFSDPEFSRKITNSSSNKQANRQICALETKRVKNLDAAKTIEKNAAGETTTKGHLVNYEAKLILKGLKPKTIINRVNTLRLLQKRGADLLKPESVFHAINNAKRYSHKTKQLLEKGWSDGTKNNAAQAYKTLCEICKIPIPEHINFDTWTQKQEKLPWLPLSKEVDNLIGGCSRKVATFLQLLKETGCRSGEAWRLKWTDLDLEHGILTINNPEKNGLPRQFKISGKLISMLNMLPKTGQKIFGKTQLNHFRKNFTNQRKHVAHKLQNPRIDKITFHTLRHLYGSLEYFKTKDILHVKERLGHKNIASTLIYTHLVNFKSDEYHTATSKSLKRDEELLKAGFEYVTEREEIKIYRKRK